MEDDAPLPSPPGGALTQAPDADPGRVPAKGPRWDDASPTALASSLTKPMPVDGDAATPEADDDSNAGVALASSEAAPASLPFGALLMLLDFGAGAFC